MIGRTIGSYRVLAKIGEGGMGSVWRGVDTMLDRPVAIKVLRPELASDAEVVERFRTEAVTLAKLTHPSIATVFAFIREAEELFLVMEFVEGETLDAVLRREGSFAWPRAARLGCTALTALEIAHSAGVIHRDIKPENMMLTRAGGLKLMDFGIARVTGTTRLTRAGHLVGTLHYMSPDQIKGAEPDARSDLYSLGVVLFEMVTGKLPFESSSEYSLMKKHLEDPPPPPRSLTPDLPDGLNDAILRALAKDPDERWPGAAELKAVLEPYAEADPTAAPVVTGDHHRTTPVRLRPTSLPTSHTPHPSAPPRPESEPDSGARTAVTPAPSPPPQPTLRTPAPHPPAYRPGPARKDRLEPVQRVLENAARTLSSLTTVQVAVLVGAVVIAAGILTTALVLRGSRGGPDVSGGGPGSVPTPFVLGDLQIEEPSPAVPVVEPTASPTATAETEPTATPREAQTPTRRPATQRRPTASPTPVPPTQSPTSLPPTATPVPTATPEPLPVPSLDETLRAWDPVESLADGIKSGLRDHLRSTGRWRPTGADARLWERYDGFDSAVDSLNTYLKKRLAVSKLRRNDERGWVPEEIVETRSRLDDLVGRIPYVEESLSEVEVPEAVRRSWIEVSARVRELRSRF